ncbi:unnamed protein product [Amoebophrya sp. A120]|nr:unnamed protein product [Amoebophrya sp. A120]|eukprot:GSA120T00023910001.1
MVNGAADDVEADPQAELLSHDDKDLALVDSRILLIAITTFLWAWVLIFFYMALQKSEYLLETSSLVHGLSTEMRNTYTLPKFIGEKLCFDDVKWNCLRNQVVYFVLAMFVFRLFAVDSFAAAPANVIEVLIGVVVYMVVFDVLLSIGHRVLHTHLYFWHRQHHSQRGSLPAGGWYMHICDLFIELWIPIFLPPLLFKANWLTIWTWLFLVEWDGVHTHSALDLLPGIIPGPKRHWLHHMLYFCNFGPGLGDYFLDTESRPIRIYPQEVICDEVMEKLPKDGEERSAVGGGSDMDVAAQIVEKNKEFVRSKTTRDLLTSVQEFKRTQRALSNQNFRQTMVGKLLDSFQIPLEFESSDEDRLLFYHGYPVQKNMEVPEGQPAYYADLAGLEGERRGLTYIRM